MRHVVIASVAVAVAFFPLAATATVIRIDCNGGGDYSTIQGAINNASDGDTLLVAPGVYVGDWNRNIDTRGLSLLIVSEEGPENTIIDVEDEPKYGFLFNDGEGPDTIVDGFTITRTYQMSGVRCRFGSSPTVRDCIITACYNIAGGGISCKEGSSPAFQDCVISNNSTVGEGAGVYCWDSCSPVFERCIFEANSAGSWGGAVCLSYYCAPLFVDCIFAGNTGVLRGGGVYCTYHSSPVFSGCVFSDNEAPSGGGLQVRDYSSVAIGNCLFSGNYASNQGGGLQCGLSDVSITNSTFVGNGSVYGAVLFVDTNASVEIQNSIIAFSTEGWTVCAGDNQVTCQCTDVYGNAWSDWSVGLDGQYPGNGNQHADPMFCMGIMPGNTLGPDSYTLYSCSPCAPDDSNGCGLIGARPVGCWVTPVRDVTWGAVKARYR